MEEKDTRAYSRRLMIGALLASAVYIGVLIWLGWDRWCQLQTSKLNEVGDFLAGAFSPLAFFWLVVGYFQQGRELSQNTEALMLQHKEMQASVQQAKELVDTAKKEQEASQARWDEERRLRAEERMVNLVAAEQTSSTIFLEDGSTGKSQSVMFHNLGGEAVGLTAFTDDSRVKVVVKSSTLVVREGAMSLRFDWNPEAFLDEPHFVRFVVQYTDSSGRRMDDTFTALGNWRLRGEAGFNIMREKTEPAW